VCVVLDDVSKKNIFFVEDFSNVVVESFIVLLREVLSVCWSVYSVGVRGCFCDCGLVLWCGKGVGGVVWGMCLRFFLKRWVLGWFFVVWVIFRLVVRLGSGLIFMGGIVVGVVVFWS
jgi:hypothetical protein